MKLRIEIETLDFITRQLDNAEKHICLVKSSGTWAWCDRDCIDNLADYHEGFDTWLDAALDAVEPYMPESIRQTIPDAAMFEEGV